jgi:hypothetical protein
MGFDMQTAIGGGHARLLIEDVAFPLGWAQLKRLLDPRFLALLTPDTDQWFTANQGNWRGSTKAVSRDFWVGVQRWVAPRWVDVPYSWVPH